jgi:DNA (cytosine-5)-methyltransferase 1
MAGCVSDIVAFYNEIDPAAAAWLRWLIDHGHIAPGVVDTRSITEIQPHDLDGFTQVHFFAGIGGWSHAARLAGWPDDRPLWTGSCPCQPFSVAGKGAGSADARHLWPDFHRLISARRPAVVMGEQVAGAAGYGWFDGVAADLASENYASRYVDIPSCAVDAPHIRQRGYWIAVANAESQRGGRDEPQRGSQGRAADGRADARGDVGDAIGARLEGQRRHGNTGGRPNEARPVAAPNGTFWSDAEWLTCHDGKARRAQPGIPMLVDGLPGRVAAWRGFGNAINPVLAAEVIAAFLDVGDDH